MGVRLSGIATKASALAGTERLEVTQSGVTKYTDPAQIADYVASVLGGGLKVACVGNPSWGSSPATAFTWFTQSDSTELYDPDGILSIVSNAISLTSGKYIVIFHGNYAWQDTTFLQPRIQLRIRNVTDSTDIALSDNDVSVAPVEEGGAGGIWTGQGQITVSAGFSIAATKTIRAEWLTTEALDFLGVWSPASTYNCWTFIRFGDA